MAPWPVNGESVHCRVEHHTYRLVCYFLMCSIKMKCILGILCSLLLTFYHTQANDVTGCGGFVVSSVNINYSPIKIKLYTGQGVLKFQTDCAPNNGYYFIPLMESHGDYVVQIEGPKGWAFEPAQVPFTFDGKTDICSKNTDINFVFKGFSIFGKVCQ